MNDDVIQRLRASNMENYAGPFQEGFESGQRWAKDDATAPQLSRLEQSDERRKGFPWEKFFHLEPVSTCQAELVAFDICAEKKFDGDTAWGFWKEVLADEWRSATNREFVRGFVDGALSVWQDVKPHL